jgi:hypothetical protein
MYLREVFVTNSGPIERLHLELAFSAEGAPIPTVIVGKNGTGKTNLLSLIVDALMEGASRAFSNVLTQQGIGRSYFRILGGKTVTAGKTHGFTILRFHDDVSNTDVFYHENTGGISPEAAKELTPPTLNDGITWPNEESSKAFNIDEKQAKAIFVPGVYLYSPSSRSEHPFWFNRESIASDNFEVADRFTQRLEKPLLVEHGLEAFTQWVLGALTESRMKVDSAEFIDGTEKKKITLEVDTADYMPSQHALMWANGILQIVTGDTAAEFFWAGRRNTRKVGIRLWGKDLTTGLESLSGGQATLIALFGAIIRYSDISGYSPGGAQGIVIIDELDAHMHVDLLVDTLPKLISMFSGIQFIVTSHSPLFALGMEKQFSMEGVRIIELPSGLTSSAESYGEFEHALAAMKNTQAFEQELNLLVKAGESPVVLVGGKTDVGYFRAAALVLGFDDLINVFEGVGKFDATDDKNSGDGNLTNAVHFIQANPNVTQRVIIAVYDCDANKVAKGDERVHVIKLAHMAERKMKKGIENMLPDDAFTSDMYDEKKIDGDYGDNFSKPHFNKNRACEMLTGENAVAVHFEDFKPVLEQIRMILTPGESTVPESEPVETSSQGQQSDVAAETPATGTDSAPSSPSGSA